MVTEMTDQVLVVEDVPEVRDWLVALAERELGAQQVFQASSVDAALKHVRTQPLTLALVDIGLPDGSGISVIRAIKRQSPACSCVVTTIFDDSDNLFSALHAGADGYLLKDEPEVEMIANLSGILDGRPPLSAAIARKVLQAFHPVNDTDAGLTGREEQMLTLIARGYSVRHAAQTLGISPHTAAGYLKTVYQKLQVNSRAEATMKAVTLGLVSMGDLSAGGQR